MIEIERKFLVRSSAYRGEALRKAYIAQGFLSTDPDRTVRVRIKGDKGVLTVKGRSNHAGTTRKEWEYEIPRKDAVAMLELCPVVIEKNRYEILVGPHLFEVDEFEGQNAGLVVAEVELSHEGEQFERPEWLGKEVTGQVRYYNAQLALAPYSTWEKGDQ
jgi:CYTH domain-containing protein